MQCSEIKSLERIKGYTALGVLIIDNEKKHIFLIGTIIKYFKPRRKGTPEHMSDTVLAK